MRKCAAITSSGTACKGIPIEGSQYCYMHDPNTAEIRRRNGVKGGKRGSRGRPSAEVAAAKSEIRRIIDALEEGTIETRVGGVMFQGWNTLLRAIEAERNVVETQELQAMVEELYESHEKGRRAI
jgi:hypothetical protein